MRVFVLFLGAGLASGCASVNGASLTAKSVKGKPAVDAGGPSLGAGIPLQDHMEMIRHLSARPVTKESAGASAESADPRLKAALAADAASPTAENHLHVAQEYLRLRILDTAYTYANRAVLQKPRFAGRTRCWRGSGETGAPRLGIGPASRAIYFDPASASAENTLGTLLDALGQPAEARWAFKRAVAVDPGAAYAFNNLCFVELRLGRLAEARSHCEAALAADPQLTEARNNLALTFVASGDSAAARQAFLAGGDAAAAAYNRGIVHMASRAYTRAAEAFEEAIAARPNFTAAKARAHEARMLAITAAND